jgi:hypothetical protein
MRLELTPSYMSPTKEKMMAEQTEVILVHAAHPAIARPPSCCSGGGGFEGAVVSALE